MRFGSLFAGIGGIDLGLERAGMECAWQVEIDDYCQKVLAKHWPNVPKFGDIKECGAHNLGQVDLIAGGFPCQDISSANTAGPRAGLAGEKSGLWREYRRIVKELRPDWVVVENSPRWKAWTPYVRKDLGGFGYVTTAIRLCSSWFGAPCRRRRCFVVANANGDSESLLAINEKVAGFSPVPGDVWDGRKPASLNIRVDDGVPRKMDRLRGLGNAVVPQVAEYVGRLIMDANPGKDGG